uniref:Beta_elim_lyase domain-containing protein n=1 Tax=Haemonchus contortus TaxID=6289 RepID=A0A7I4YQU7_HAECO
YSIKVSPDNIMAGTMQRLWRISSLLRIRVDCGRDLRIYQKRRMVTKPTPQYTTTVPNSAQCIDMRSDTVTLPSDEMKEAMVKAVLGDDVYGEDRTVNELEERCAQLFGKEAGLFVASGTMGNLLAIMAHCQRGDEIIVGRYNHIHRWEQGNYAQLAGVSATTVNVGSDGTMEIDDIEDAIRVQDIHMPNTRLICLETTHNYSGGRPLPLDYIRSVRELASKHGLNVHIDGARIYNAAVALEVEVRDIAQYADSVMMCFSKGLGAPVGSILVGSKAFIDKARRSRKAVGGGWRQAGVLAAAAHVALNNAEKTIRRDHANAQKLASGINAITPDNLKDAIHASDVGITNMVILKCNNGVSPIQVQKFFESRGVLMMLFDATRVRIVLNWGVTEEDVEKVLGHYKEFIQSLTNS